METHQAANAKLEAAKARVKAMRAAAHFRSSNSPNASASEERGREREPPKTPEIPRASNTFFSVSNSTVASRPDWSYRLNGNGNAQSSKTAEAQNTLEAQRALVARKAEAAQKAANTEAQKAANAERAADLRKKAEAQKAMVIQKLAETQKAEEAEKASAASREDEGRKAFEARKTRGRELDERDIEGPPGTAQIRREKAEARRPAQSSFDRRSAQDTEKSRPQMIQRNSTKEPQSTRKRQSKTAGLSDAEIKEKARKAMELNRAKQLAEVAERRAAARKTGGYQQAPVSVAQKAAQGKMEGIQSAADLNRERKLSKNARKGAEGAEVKQTQEPHKVPKTPRTEKGPQVQTIETQPQARKAESHEREASIGPNQKVILDVVSSLGMNPEYSDFKLLCRGSEYALHKCIVCPRSKFLAAACNRNIQGSQSGQIGLHAEEPALIKQMATFFYTGDYSFSNIMPSEKRLEDEQANNYKPATIFPDALSFHVAMYVLADRMLVPTLKSMCKQKVESELMSTLGESSFPKMIETIYNTTPVDDRGLRDMAVSLTVERLADLRAGVQGTGSQPIALTNELLKSVPQFCYDLCVASVDQHVGVKSARKRNFDDLEQDDRPMNITQKDSRPVDIEWKDTSPVNFEPTDAYSVDFARKDTRPRDSTRLPWSPQSPHAGPHPEPHPEKYPGTYPGPRKPLPPPQVPNRLRGPKWKKRKTGHGPPHRF